MLKADGKESTTFLDNLSSEGEERILLQLDAEGGLGGIRDFRVARFRRSARHRTVAAAHLPAVHRQNAGGSIRPKPRGLAEVFGGKLRGAADGFGVSGAALKRGSGVGERFFERGDDRLDGLKAAGNAQQVR